MHLAAKKQDEGSEKNRVPAFGPNDLNLSCVDQKCGIDPRSLNLPSIADMINWNPLEVANFLNKEMMMPKKYADSFFQLGVDGCTFVGFSIYTIKELQDHLNNGLGCSDEVKPVQNIQIERINESPEKVSE